VRGVAIAVIFWIGIVPSLLGSFLILTFLAASLPLVYFALTWLAFSFTAFAVFVGPLYLAPLARPELQDPPSFYRNSTSFEEMEHERYFAGKIRS